MKPRCRSVFQNYEHFQAWQDVSELSCCNLLQKLNTNLNSYQKNYKKYINFQGSQSKKQSKQSQNQKHPENFFLPTLNVDPNLVAHSLNLSTQKVLVSEQKHLKNEQIFCQRSNNILKHKTLSFQKGLQLKFSSKKRRLSFNQQKNHSISRLINKNQNNQIQDKQNLHCISPMIDSTSKLQGYAKLRYRLKKAANKSKLFHEEKYDQKHEKSQKDKLFYKRKYDRINFNIKDVQEQGVGSKLNEFSDQIFHEKNLRDKFALRR